MIGFVILGAVAQLATQGPSGHVTVEVVDRRTDPHVPHHATLKWRQSMEGEVLRECRLDVGTFEWDLPRGWWVYQVQGDSIAEVWGTVSIDGKHEPRKSTVVLEDGATIEGRVLDPDGNPVADAPVYFWRPVMEKGEVDQGWELRTSEDGDFHWEHVRPGRLFVWSTVAPYAVMRPPPRDVLDGETVRLELKFEQPCQIQIVVENVKLARVTCFQGESPLRDYFSTFPVLGLSKTPACPWLTLNLDPHEQETLRLNAGARKGRLSIERLPPGRHRIWIAAEGFHHFETEVVLTPGCQEVVFPKLEPRKRR